MPVIRPSTINLYYANVYALEVWYNFFLVKIMKVKAYLNYKKRVMGIISSVSKQRSKGRNSRISTYC
jgi:hypothetical protein